MFNMLLKGALKLRGKAMMKFQKSRALTSETLASLSSTALTGAQEFSQYEMRLPSHQNAIELIPGWSSAFPFELGLKAGNIPLFADIRILNALKAYGAIRDKTILEVGPLEAMHTHILNQCRPARIDAIEANKLCFLRCLVTKDILKLDRANFYLGDIQSWLHETETVYDLAIASGVLYHMQDPADFLSLISARSNAIFIWTHFFDEQAMPTSDLRLLPFSGRVETRDVDGLKLHYHERTYSNANTNASFCGGMKDKHYWMRKDENLLLLAHFGFTEIVELEVDLDHPGGPCFSVFARKQDKAVSPET